ncbi:MAG TPA: permease prefix domain 1-containing protein [Candidatus Krumholzibacteria bacterium]|nr:permease prefix domain 1-containing protein [Candidatus Krumholzibacteria bacterium]
MSEGQLEARIGEWRQHFLKRQAIRAADVDELEDHLRSQVDALRDAGLDEDEAFLVAVKRLGDLDSVSREFANEYTERLWKQLVVSPGSGDASPAAQRDTWLAVGFAIAAAVAIKVPELFGLHMHGPDAAEAFYVRNIGLLVLPFLAAFFALKRCLPRAGWSWLVLPFAAAGVIVNLLPFTPNGDTFLLSSIHVPIALWLTVGFAYAGGRWRSHDQRMNFVRFSGEWFIYYALIALGGAVLMLFTAFVFEAIGLSAEPAIERWILPCGAAGAVLIAAWLVEAKQGVIESMAPVLTMLFTPLFAVLLLVFIVTMIATGSAIDVGREVLIGFDLLLVLVLGLLLYAFSARDTQAAPGKFDTLRLLLVLCALVVDGLALWSMVARTSEFGFSPNKTAALGLNVLLLVNLGGSALLYTRFLTGRAAFARLVHWQTTYLPLFAAWAWIVAALFPIIFKYQ